MELKSINQVPRGSKMDGYSVEVETPGFGKYFIHIYTKGARRYLELTGWYTGKHIFSTSIRNDRAESVRMVEDIADGLVARYKNKEV